MPALAPQVGVPGNSPRIAANTSSNDALNVPEKVQDFAQNFKAVAMNHPYFRRTWGGSAKDAAISFGSLARNAIINRYGTQDAEGRSHFLGMTTRETPGVLQILKRFATRTPNVVVPKKEDVDKATEKDNSDKGKQTDAKKVESRAAAEEVNRENMRLVQAQTDALKSIDANVKTILQTIVELKKADDQKGLQNNVEANNAQNPSLFSSLFDFLNVRRNPNTTVPKTRRNVFSRVLNASKALVTRASATFSPLATKVSAPITKTVSAVREANITNKLTKGIDLAKNSASQGTKTVAQNSLQPKIGNLAEKAKTGNAQLLDVAKKGGSRGVELAKETGKSVLKLMPKNLVNKIPVIGAVAGGALAIADYNDQAEQIDEQVRAGNLTQAEGEALKRNAAKKGAGSTAGTAVGASIGATVGSIIPGLGTIVGGFVGGYLGEKIGGLLGDSFSEDPKVAELNHQIDVLEAQALTPNGAQVNGATIRNMKKTIDSANIDPDAKAELNERLDRLNKRVVQKRDTARTVLTHSVGGQPMVAQASPTNQALTPNGAQSYASAFDAKVEAPRVENSGNTNVMQVNNNSTNNTISSFGLTTRNGDDSLRRYRQSNFATIG